MARRLHGLGSFAAGHKWVVLAAWLVLLAVVVGLVKSVGANTSNNLELPGTNSQDANDLLAKRFPPQQNGKNPIVFQSPESNGKITDSENKQAIQASFKAMKDLGDRRLGSLGCSGGFHSSPSVSERQKSSLRQALEDVRLEDVRLSTCA